MVHTFEGDGEREVNGNLIVHCERGLPILRHLELGIHARHGAAGLVVGIGQVFLEIEFINCRSDIGNHTAVGAGRSELAQLGRIDGGQVTGIPGTRVLDGVLDHTCVGRHVGEVHQRETALEDTGTAAHLQALVAEYVIDETDTRVDLDLGGGPLAGVDIDGVAVSIFEVVGKDRLVGSDVGFVEEDGVEADTCSHLKIVIDSPFVLSVSAQLVEGNLCVRVEVSVPAIGDGEGFRRTVQHIDDVCLIGPRITIVHRTVTHVRVVCELVFVVHTGGDLVSAHGVDQVVLDGHDVVVHTVIPGEEFVTEGHVRLPFFAVLLDDINVRERVGVGTADIVDLGVGDEQLLGEVVGETAVVIEGKGLHLVVHRVHVVSEGHRIVTHAVGTVQTVAGIGRVAVRSIPSRILRKVITEAQTVVTVDVPVETGQNLGVGLVAREVGVGTGVVTVLGLHILLNGGQVGFGTAGNAGIGVRFTALVCAVLDHLTRVLLLFEVDEEEEFVLDDGTADGGTDNAVGFSLAVATVNAGDGVTAHVLVAVVAVNRALEGVGTGLGDSVDTAADEVGLADVIRRNHHLDLFESIHGDRGAAAGELVGKTEVVVEVGTVDGEVGGTTVTAGEAHAVCIRGDAGQVGDAAVHRRHLLHLLAVDARRSAGLLGSELRSRSDDNDLFQLGCSGLQRCVLDIHFTEVQRDALIDDGFATHHLNLDIIRAARTHTHDGVTAFGVGDSIVLRTRRGVGCDDSCTGNGALLIHDLTAHRRGGHLCGHRKGDEQAESGQSKKLKGFFHKRL